MESILYLIFNRLDYAKQSFEGIRAAKPKRLYVFADGPRFGKLGEAQLCQETRKIIEGVDWDCEVITNFQDKNLGASVAALDALDWVFEHEESVVYIEEDIVMGPGAAEFYNQIMLKYSESKEVGFISGYNPLGQNITSNEYFFADSPFACFGMATTRAVWQDYRKTIAALSEKEVKDLFSEAFKDFQNLGKIRIKHYIRAKLGQVKIEWDFFLSLYCAKKNKLCVLPRSNLIIHIGEYGTHIAPTKFQDQNFGNIECEEFIGPKIFAVDQEMLYKRYTFLQSLEPHTFIGKIANLIGVFTSVKSIDEFALQIKLFFKRRYLNYRIRNPKE